MDAINCSSPLHHEVMHPPFNTLWKKSPQWRRGCSRFKFKSIPLLASFLVDFDNKTFLAITMLTWMGAVAASYGWELVQDTRVIFVDAVIVVERFFCFLPTSTVLWVKNWWKLLKLCDWNYSKLLSRILDLRLLLEHLRFHNFSN